MTTFIEKNNIVILVMWMRYIEIPEFLVLRGEKAVKALCDFISELEEQRGKELTEKQTDALIKLARGLISSIEAEEQAATSDKDIKRTWFVSAPAHTPLPFSMGAAPLWYAFPKQC